MLSFFPLNVLDEILDLIDSVSEGFPTYFCLYRESTISIHGIINALFRFMGTLSGKHLYHFYLPHFSIRVNC